MSVSVNFCTPFFLVFCVVSVKLSNSVEIVLKNFVLIEKDPENDIDYGSKSSDMSQNFVEAVT